MPVDLSVFHKAAPYRSFRAEDWNILSEILKEVRYEAGKTLFKENDPGEGLYLVRSGRVLIRRRFIPEGVRTAQEQVLAVLTPGEILGEMALVDGAPRSADALVEEDSVLFHLTQSDYVTLQHNHTGTALRIQDLLVITLCSRIRAADRNFEIIRFFCT